MAGLHSSPLYSALVVALTGPPEIGVSTLARVLQAALRELRRHDVTILPATSDVGSLEQRLIEAGRLQPTLETDAKRTPVIIVDGFPQSAEGVRALYDWGALSSEYGALVVCRPTPRSIRTAATHVWETGELLPGSPPRADEGEDVGLPGLQAAARARNIPIHTIWVRTTRDPSLTEDAHAEASIIDMAEQLAELLGV